MLHTLPTSPAHLRKEEYFYDAFNRCIYYLQEGQLRAHQQASNT